MNGPASQAVQHGSFFFLYGNFALSGKLNDIFYFTGMRFARDVYALNGNAARTDGFKHGVDTADTILHYSRNTNATASAAMASSVPTMPRCSMVFALTWTLLAAMPRTCAIFACISGKYGSNFGR